MKHKNVIRIKEFTTASELRDLLNLSSFNESVKASVSYKAGRRWKVGSCWVHLSPGCGDCCGPEVTITRCRDDKEIWSGGLL